MSTGSETLSGKILFITGASRGIGKAIALRAARDGAHIIVASKTDQPHPKLEGTIHTALEEIQAAGGQGLAVRMDVRNDDEVDAAVEKAVAEFGGIDILVNNASAIMLKDTQELPMRRFDLMFEANVRGSYTTVRACIPHLLKAANPHVLNLSPPLNLNPDWFAPHVAYTMSKYGMSMCVLGMAEEFRKTGVAFNSLWPRTVIATAALNQLDGSVSAENCRTPEIMADAAHEILTRNSRECTGHFFLDENVLRSTGMKNFDQYSVVPGKPLMKDLFLD